MKISGIRETISICILSAAVLCSCASVNARLIEHAGQDIKFRQFGNAAIIADTQAQSSGKDAEKALDSFIRYTQENLKQSGIFKDVKLNEKPAAPFITIKISVESFSPGTCENAVPVSMVKRKIMGEEISELFPCENAVFGVKAAFYKDNATEPAAEVVVTSTYENGTGVWETMDLSLKKVSEGLVKYILENE